MKSVWFPAILSTIVIALSAFFIKSGPVVSPPTLIAITTATPTPVATGVVLTDNYSQVNAKCGQLPLLPDYSETRFRGDYSLRTWSPSCRFIAWSATIKYSFGPWSASPYEGLFIYDLKTKKVTRIYTPQSENDSVVFVKWLSDNELVFHQATNNLNNVYNMFTQTFSQL
jgi:hypothetical protein